MQQIDTLEHSQLVDTFGRKITYLRISITDRCNFRCAYCMPPDGVELKAHNTIMRYEEILEVVREAVKLGVRSVRITGGEPLVRPDVPLLIGMLSGIEGLDDISLTTNGFLLEKYAAALADSGLNRINVSLDTLNPQKFRKITRVGDPDRVLRGIDAAEAAGLKPIKINAVVIRGFNDNELVDLAQLSISHPWHIRFIELMPVNNQESWGADFVDPLEAFVSVQEMRDILKPLKLVPEKSGVGRGPARTYRIPDAKGLVGFISPLGEHFCASCNRLRLTADGRLRPCLLSDVEIPLLEALRSGQDVLPYLQLATSCKPHGHELDENHLPKERTMKEIGG